MLCVRRSALGGLGGGGDGGGAVGDGQRDLVGLGALGGEHGAGGAVLGEALALTAAAGLIVLGAAIAPETTVAAW